MTLFADVVIATKDDLPFDFAPLKYEFTCSRCGYADTDPGLALDHSKACHPDLSTLSEEEFLNEVLNQFYSGAIPMIYTYSNEALRTIENDVIGEIDYPF